MHIYMAPIPKELIRDAQWSDMPTFLNVATQMYHLIKQFSYVR